MILAYLLKNWRVLAVTFVLLLFVTTYAWGNHWKAKYYVVKEEYSQAQMTIQDIEKKSKERIAKIEKIEKRVERYSEAQDREIEKLKQEKLDDYCEGVAQWLNFNYQQINKEWSNHAF